MYLENKYCYECAENTDFHNGKCSICFAKKADRERREHFARLKGLTLEERIEELEKWRYELMLESPWIYNRYY